VDKEFSHQPVLISEILETFQYLKDRRDPVFVDGTIGLAGHSLAIAKNIKNIKVIGVDKDQNALRIAGAKLKKYDFIRYELVNDKFENIDEILRNLSVEKVDGILFDLGVSSMQLDDESRGFSFQADAELDMRMNLDQERSAKEVVNSYPENELVRIFSDYGEERFSKTIARKIVEARKVSKIITTKQLADIVVSAIPAKFRKTKILNQRQILRQAQDDTRMSVRDDRRRPTNPATNIFRAIRMEVNSEVSDLKIGSVDAVSKLRSGGRLAVIAFHSIEDRIVKQTFSQLENPCTCPPKQPVCSCGQKAQVKILTKKPIVPSEEEIGLNPRSRSAKLRVVERL
jgi:16S rRNA (cytosine1402-N4)-methyltransferase